MEVPFTRAQEARLNEIADTNGTSVSDLLLDAAASVIRISEEHWAAVDRAIAQADRGEFIEEEEMDARLVKMLAH